MADISAKMVKELMNMTGAGVMACKKALVETDGDMDKAVEELRKKGLAAAQKKASRIAAEGVVATVVSEDQKKGVIVEVNCETDFVATNAKFKGYVARVAQQAFESSANTLEELMAEPWIDDTSVTVEQALSQEISVIGEKISIRRFQKIVTDGLLCSYIHMGGKIGVLLEMATAADPAAVAQPGQNIAMQIAAMRPKYLNRAQVSQEYLEHEKEILLAQIMNDPKESKKPEKVIQGIIMGRVNKELKEICLEDQVFFMAEDGKQTIKQYADQVAKEVGAPFSIKSYVRYEKGEGIEKREEDFAAEVAKQMGK